LSLSFVVVVVVVVVVVNEIVEDVDVDCELLEDNNVETVQSEYK
jgi:hypothetical protein